MISRSSLDPEELTRKELCRLIEIAHETPYCDLRKSAMALLMTSPLLFPESPIAAEEEEMEALSAAWGPVGRDVIQSMPVPTVDDIRPTNDGIGSPSAPEPQSEKTTAEMLAEECVINEPLNTGGIGPDDIERAIATKLVKSKRKPSDWSAEETERLTAFVAANPAPRRWDPEIIRQLFPERSPKAAQMRAERLGLGKSGGAKAAASENPDVTYDVATERLKSQRRIEPNPMPSEPPGVKTSPGAETRAQQVTQAKENLDEMFPPDRASAIREAPPSRVEPNPSKAKPVATFPPAWEPKETFKAPETIDDVMAWCRRQGDDVAQDGKMFTVNGRKLFPSEFIARANNLRRAAGVMPFDIIINEAAAE